MKKIDVFFKCLILLLLCSLFSCKLTINDSKGRLIVSNYSENDNVTITDVYVKEKHSSGYVLVYSDIIKNSQSYFIELKPGQYSVKIKTHEKNPILYKKNYYETGYNIYKNLKENKAIKVTFDGKGIFLNRVILEQGLPFSMVIEDKGEFYGVLFFVHHG